MVRTRNRPRGGAAPSSHPAADARADAELQIAYVADLVASARATMASLNPAPLFDALDFEVFSRQDWSRPVKATPPTFALDMITVGIWNHQSTMDEEFLFWDGQAFFQKIGLA